MTRTQKLALNIFAVLALAFGLSMWPPTTAVADDYRPVSLNWAVSAPGTNTDALATDITWRNSSPGLRLTIQVETSTVVNLMVTRGATEYALGLNSNTALTAGAVYSFDVHGMQAGDLVNVQVETDSIIDTLAIGYLRFSQ